MPVHFTPQHLVYLAEAYYLFFTTLRGDQMPLPTPVWFVVEGDTILTYSNPQALKVKNIQRHPLVALSHNRDVEGEEYLIITGEAHIDRAAPTPAHHAAYLKKYEIGIPRIGMTIESYDAYFSLPIRITPHRVRMYEISPEEFMPKE